LPSTFGCGTLCRLVDRAQGEGKMTAARLQELEDMATRLLVTVRQIPPGQERHDVLEQIGKIRVQIAALQGPDLGPAPPGLKGK
jgi:hypothetical protein